MKKICVLLFLLLSLSLVIGCTKEVSKSNKNQTNETKEEIHSYKEKIRELKEKNSEYEIRNKTLEEEIDGYEKFVKETIKYLDDDELLNLAKSQWNYKIEVEGKPIISDKDIEINKKDFEIIFSEEQSFISSITNWINEKGSIIGEYKDHLKILGKQPTDIKRTDGTIVSGFIYEFKDLPENTNLKLELSNELKERLRLNSNTINIHVR